MGTSEVYCTVLADPGWEYDQPLKMADGVKRSSRSQYATMPVQQICDLYQSSQVQHVKGHRGQQYVQRPGLLAGYPIADTALLGLWITAPMLLAGIHQRVCDAWGFTPRQIVPWIKGRLAVEYGFKAHDPVPVGRGMQMQTHEQIAIPKLVVQPGMGHLTRGCVEYLILATRGKYTSLVKTHSENGLLLAEEEAFIVAPKSTHSRKPKAAHEILERLFPGPYLELFAREQRDGWTCHGNEMPPPQRDEEPPLPLADPASIDEPPVSWS